MAVSQAWLGAVTTTSAVIRARSDQSSLSATTDPSTETFNGSEGSDDVFLVSLTGLSADTEYEVTVDDGDGTWVATFTTAPSGADSFTFAIGGDSGHSGGGFDSSGVSPTAPTWLSIAEDNPAFFIDCGDLHYKDISTDNVSLFYAAYQGVIAGNCATMLQSVPIVYAWDDHDFGANDSNGTSASKPAAQSAYRTWVPHYPLDDDDGIWQSFTWGRVKFIVMDGRSNKSVQSAADNASKTMYGTDQIDWLEAELDTDAPLIVWMPGSTWHGQTNDEVDWWASYKSERRSISEMFTRLDVTRRLLIVCADAHMLAYDDGTNTQYDPVAGTYGPRLVQCGKIDAGTVNIGGPYTIGPLNPSSQMYCTVDVADDGTNVDVTVRGWSVSGTTETEIITESFRAGELFPARRLVPVTPPNTELPKLGWM